MATPLVSAKQVAAAMDDVTEEQVQQALDSIFSKADEGGYFPSLTEFEAEVEEVYRELYEQALGLSHFVLASREVLARFGLS